MFFAGLERLAMPTGTVKWFNVKKGFGFIQNAADERDIFVHYTAIVGDGFRILRDGESVEYELADSDRGPQAVNVRRPSVSSDSTD